MLNISLPGLVDVEEISVLVVSSLMPAVSHSLHRSPYPCSQEKGKMERKKRY
jgi:hypothetical protein